MNDLDFRDDAALYMAMQLGQLRRKHRTLKLWAWVWFVACWATVLAWWAPWK
jgi:hypothetical protein